MVKCLMVSSVKPGEAGTDGPQGAAIEAPGAQQRRAAEQQQPEIHRMAAAAQCVHTLQHRQKVRRGTEKKFYAKNTQQNQNGPLGAGHSGKKLLYFCAGC